MSTLDGVANRITALEALVAALTARVEELERKDTARAETTPSGE